MRAKYGNNNILIPIKFIQEQGSFKNNDFRFWTGWWNNECSFEKGTTIGSFFLCLEPWSTFWSDYVNVDLPAYISEIKTPTDISDIDISIDYAELSFHNEIEPKVEYHPDNNKLFQEDFEAWINSPKKYRLSGEWELSSHYKLIGFKNDEEGRYGIEDSPLNKISNLPLFLKEKQYICFSKWQYNKIIKPLENNLFSNNSFGIKQYRDDIDYLIADKFHHLKDVIDGFFSFFHTTPSTRNRFTEEVKEALLEAEQLNKQNIVPSDNVVPLFPSQKNENQEMNIVSVNQKHIESIVDIDKEFWENLLALAKNNNNVVIKMGKIENATPEEFRIFATPSKNPEQFLPTDYITN